MRPLNTTRCTLEPLTASHAEAMFALLSDPLIYAFGGVPPVSAAALRERYARLESRSSPDGQQQWLNWVVRLHAGGEVAGYVQATVGATGDALIGYELGSRFWGRGLGAEVVAAMLAELLGHHYQVAGFSATLDPANQRSRRLLQGLGFAQVEPSHNEAAEMDAGDVLMRRCGKASASAQTSAPTSVPTSAR